MLHIKTNMLITFRKNYVDYVSGLVIVIILLHFTLVFECKDLDNYVENMSKEIPPVEVTAVFINCELDDIKENPNIEATRFEREELFKHNALRDCNKKLALTVKMPSEPTNSGDEFVPIDHVLEGSGKKRVRLLEPYVLRLRREALLQAYKLRLIDRVHGVLTMSNDYNQVQLQELDKQFKETQRDTGNTRGPGVRQGASLFSDIEAVSIQDEKRASNCKHTSRRLKREEHEQNVVIEEELSDKNILQSQNDNLDFKNEQFHEDGRLFQEPSVKTPLGDNSFETLQMHYSLKDKHQNGFSPAKTKGYTNVDIEHENTAISALEETNRNNHLYANRKHIIRNPAPEQQLSGNSGDRPKANAIDGSEKDFALYEIGSPDLWFKVHVQIFEKLSTDKGNTLWNDITKGEFASVSSMRPEWSGQDMNVQYRPADFVSREEFTLPITSLCLLVPLLEEDMNSIPSDDDVPRVNDVSYIVVPSEDVVSVDKIGRGINNLANVSNEDMKGRRKRVVVRVARALWNVMEDNINIDTQGSDRYLTMLHRRPHRAQVDLEVRADENQLVRIGSSGRVAIVVADSTRRARSTITVQATNTGLAAARFRVQIRECDFGLLNLVKQNGGGEVVEGPVLIPPRHTRRLRLELPVALPSELQHCSVSLLNDNDESVAVRDVVIRRGDRCFCVWHCDCVCFEENPKLPCQEMSPARQAAAGLAARRGARHARSTCYCDKMPLNVFIMIIGVIVALLFFGLLKGVIGLVFPPVSVWGLDRILQTPRTLDHYYECALRSRPVQYDCRGWPVHPDTGERSVQVVSRTMALILNIIFFVVTPGLLLLALIKRVVHCKRGSAATDCRQTTGKGNKAHEQQSQMRRSRRRRRALRRWMTPHADRLTTNLWQKDLNLGSSQCDYVRPLLGGARAAPAAPSSDSEQDDTAFVLMHMQNSAESLAKSQRKLNMTSQSTASHEL